MSATKALEIPEIVHLIGLNIPVLDTFNHRFYQEPYNPKTLLNCCLVSKSWRAILLPVLWRLYDGNRMSIVPRHIVIQYRSLFRYYRGQVMPLSEEEEGREREQERGNQDVAPSHAITSCASKDLDSSINLEVQPQQQKQQQSHYNGLDCRNLLELEVLFTSQQPPYLSAPLPVYFGLLRSNPQLKEVVLYSTIRAPRLAMSALGNCTKLLRLTIVRFTTAQGDGVASDLGRFLRPVSATLTTLYLVELEGNPIDPTTIWLPQVTDLTIDVSNDSGTHSSMKLEELIARCPSLVRLLVYPRELSTKLDRLAALIKSHCPKLTSIWIPRALSTDTEVCKVIRAVTAGRLLSLNCTVPRTTKGLQEAIRAHQESLETLKIEVAFYIREPVDYVNGREAGVAELIVEQMVFLQEVLDSFLSLKELSFKDRRDRTSELEFYDALMHRPWNCLSLERLKLEGGIYDVWDREALVPGRPFGGGGWRIDRKELGRAKNIRLNYGLLRRLLRHVSALPRLSTVRAVGLTCVRNADLS
ncbi:hypothetical protein BGZ96_012023 [Linnemannia gamsii]|uniref:F-box domain-containing protein n=1 Tax=Linnemannia gamsii TaxID=64522 RepID=A0ABQ7JRR7_9FUNG|nr:hypothetical protein BGZ96_012023 [Linnemannia gamsii]